MRANKTALIALAATLLVIGGAFALMISINNRRHREFEQTLAQLQTETNQNSRLVKVICAEADNACTVVVNGQTIRLVPRANRTYAIKANQYGVQFLEKDP